MVIASGDFTFIGSPEEFAEATTALSLLLGVLDLSPDYLIVIPGNHDIQWGDERDVFGQYSDKAVVVTAPPDARKNYETFYTTS